MRLFFGWYVVIASFCIAVFGWGFGFYGLAVYLSELRALHGWSAGFIGTTATVYYLFGALLLALYDPAVRRLGQRTVTLAGILAMAAGVASLPFVDARWQLVAAYLLMAVGWSTMSLTAVTAWIAPWFVRRRGLAISLALNGASCGGILLAPGMMWLSSGYGFAIGAGACVMIMLVVLVPMVLGIAGRVPGDLGSNPDGDHFTPSSQDAGGIPGSDVPGQRLALLGSGRFWAVACPFALGLLAQVGFLTHQVAFLQPRLGSAGAGLALSLTTAAAVAGRIALGTVVDRLEPRATTAASLVSQALALLVLILADAAWISYAASAVFGLSVGNLITLPALVVQREFESGDFIAVVAAVAATSQVFYAFGPGLIGVLHDAAGGYGPALVLCMALELAAALMLLVRRPAT